MAAGPWRCGCGSRASGPCGSTSACSAAGTRTWTLPWTPRWATSRPPWPRPGRCPRRGAANSCWWAMARAPCWPWWRAWRPMPCCCWPCPGRPWPRPSPNSSSRSCRWKRPGPTSPTSARCSRPSAMTGPRPRPGPRSIRPWRAWGFRSWRRKPWPSSRPPWIWIPGPWPAGWRRRWPWPGAGRMSRPGGRKRFRPVSGARC